MINKTRKRIWSVSLVMSIAMVGVLAAFIVLAANPGDTQAHGASMWTRGIHCPTGLAEMTSPSRRGP